MAKVVGTVARGLIGPIVNQGDDIAEIAVDTLLHAAEVEKFAIHDSDILTITESVVARSQGNYATVQQIAQDVRRKFADDTIGLVFPILSRNRFAPCLEGIAAAGNQLVVMLSYPADEVGNHLIDPDVFEGFDINPRTDSFTVDEFRKTFGKHTHKFTGVDYIEYYESIVKAANPESFIILSNNTKDITGYTKSVLACDIHTRHKTKRLLKKYGAEKIFGLDDILTESVDGSGYNSEYGLLGSNKASDNSLKLFPEKCQPVVERVQKKVLEKTGKKIEVMIYGDGAFRDPVGKIWELADPVVSPAYTEGLEGTPREVKLKYLADNNFQNLSGDAQKKAITDYIADHQKNLPKEIDKMVSEGTTPRRLADLIGSFSDLTSGSGDKGTPFIFIQGYFDKYTG